ncbi:MAG TPA: PAS domain S-box protein, partial [Terriglobales bacterium]
MEELLRVLCVEDVPEDAELVILNLRKGGYRIEMMRVQSAEEMSKALDLHPWDIVICDYSLPRFSIDAVKLLRSRDQVTPLIFVSGSIGEETAVDALKLGAQDYVLKDQFTRLLPAVQRELRKAHERQQFDDERARKDAELRASDAKFRALIENSHDGIFLLDETQRIIFCSPSVERILGYPPQEILGTFVTELFHPDDLDLATQAFSRCLLTPGAFANCRARVRHNNGSWKITDGVCTNLLNDRNVRGLVVNFRDVTDTAAAQTELQKSEDRFGKAFKSSPLALTISTLADKRYLDANPAFLRLLGYESSEVIGRTADDLNLWVEPEGRASIIETLKRTGMSEPFQTRYRSKTGEARDVIVSADLIEIEGVPCLLAITQDVTETKRLEAQFRQAQKMEAVGRLAGGVAHDFNNLLMIMGGAADLLQAHRSDNARVDKYTTQIRDAVEKAARLTRQLLAFSRQQVLQPTVLDLNTIIKDLIKMVSRLLGEDIRIELNLNPNLSRVSADRGQIEQVIMNLAVNARDAMPDGGKLTITTQNERLEEDHIG